MIKKSRFIAFLLAAVFFVSASGPIGVTTVLAAENLNFALSYDETLVESIPNSSAPRYSINSQDLVEVDDKTPKVLAKWDFSRQGTYYLRYHMDRQREILMRVTKEGDNAEVSYRVISTTSQALVAPATYTVYSRENSGYIDYTRVDFGDDWKAARSDDGTAVFNITKDRGFSIRYGGKKIHFYWNTTGRLDDATGYPEQDKFYVVTSGATEGKIYDFELYFAADAFLYASSGGDVSGRSDPDPDPLPMDKMIPIADLTAALSGKQKIMTGITNLVSDPIANAEPKDPNRDIDGKDEHGKDELYRTKTPPEDEWPGSDTVNLKLSFDLPKEWNGSDFVVPVAGSFPDLTLRLANTQDDIRINFSDITGTASATTVGGTLIGDVLNSEPIRAGDKLSFYLTDLKAGQIFTTSFYLTGTPSNLKLKPTYIDFGHVYTYLPYLIRAVDDQFYVFVTPYADLPGYYLLKINDQVASVVRSDGTGTVMLSASSVLNRKDYYQVFFSTSEFNQNGGVPAGVANLKSQVLNYVPTLVDTTVGSPNHFKVTEYELRFSKDSKDEAELDMTLEWDIAKVSTLENMLSAQNPLTVVYAVNRTWAPGTPHTGNPFANVMVEIKEENGHITGVFTDDKGKVVSGQLMSYTDPTSGYPIYKAQVDLTVKAARDYGLSSSGIDFIFPQIYFLNVQPREVNGEPETLIAASLYDSITLNDYDVPEAPEAQNIRTGTVTTTNQDPDVVGSKDEVSLQVKWDTPIESLKAYLSYLFEGSSETPDDDTVTYNLYISQDETQMKTFVEKQRAERISKNTEDFVFDQDGRGDVLYASEINGVDPAKVLMVEGNFMREALREKTALIGIQNVPNNDPNNRITDIMNAPVTSGSSLKLSYTLDGLDKNQKYYLVVETVVKAPDNEGLQYSRLSSILADTTKGDPDILDPSEKAPPAPFFKEKEVEKSVSTLTWDRVRDNLSVPVESMEYQIIRTRDTPLDDSILDNTSLDFPNVWNSTMLGFRTSGKKLQLYTNGSFNDLTDDELYSLDTSQDPPTVKLIDKTLSTNTIYYYYIRTERVVKNAKGEDVTRYSKWNGVSLTTEPVRAPKNLKVEQDRTDFDPKRETIISFDAPITDISKLGVEFDLQYQLKKDDGDWGQPIRMNPSQLTSSRIPGVDDYLHFVYKITGLEPGTLYNIRVRMADLINEDQSLYSNIATTITETDQEDYDDKQKNQEWLDYLIQELEKLVKDPYWVSKDTASLFEAFYRPTMFDAHLSQRTGGMLQLAASEANKAVYYLPASAVLSANAANVGFQVTHGNMDVIFSPKAVDTNYNNTILEVAEKMKAKDISDYYIRLTLTWTDTPHVEGDEALTKQVNVQVEAVGSVQNNAEWDRTQMERLAELVAETAGKDSIKDQILREIQRGTSNEELVKLIARLVEDVKKDFIADISRELGKVTRFSYPVEILDAPLILVAKGLEPSATVKAYQLVSGAYLSQEVTNFGDNKAIYTRSPGIYIFTGRVLVIPGLENLPGAGALGGIIGKYGLDDLFGKDGLFNLEASATRYQVVGSVARMAGAPKGTDPFNWLIQNKGLTLSNRNSNGNIQTQEAVYLVAALYEIRTGTKIATVQIRNYSLTANMSGLSDQYKQSVRAAFELGLCSPQNFDPTASIKVKTILEMLGNLDAKSKL